MSAASVIPLPSHRSPLGTSRRSPDPRGTGPAWPTCCSAHLSSLGGSRRRWLEPLAPRGSRLLPPRRRGPCAGGSGRGSFPRAGAGQTQVVFHHPPLGSTGKSTLKYIIPSMWGFITPFSFPFFFFFHTPKALGRGVRFKCEFRLVLKLSNHIHFHILPKIFFAVCVNSFTM